METKNKKLLTVSVSKEVLCEFDKLSVLKSINKSLLIENFLREWNEDNKDILMKDNNCNNHHTYCMEK